MIVHSEKGWIVTLWDIFSLFIIIRTYIKAKPVDNNIKDISKGKTYNLWLAKTVTNAQNSNVVNWRACVALKCTETKKYTIDHGRHFLMKNNKNSTHKH